MVTDIPLSHLFVYGSQIYGTATPLSDTDYIGVRATGPAKEDIRVPVDLTLYSKQGFQQAIAEHEISVLECLWLPENQVLLSDENFEFTLNKETLRRSLSAKASNSWVKAKKKLGEGTVDIARKSLFHSLRIVLFGIQIARHGKIVDYSEANFVLEELSKLPNNWEAWDNHFRPMRNKNNSLFRELCPC